MNARPQSDSAPPDLATALVKFALLDLVGMLLLALGVAYLIQGPGSFFDSFPSTRTEAIALTALGVGVMGYAGAGILRQVARRQGRASQ
jgi:hypothetical protein